jgi:hypothetical protein
MPEEILHIVIRESGIVLLKRPGDDWRAVQDLFPDYITSVGAYTLAETLEWIELEWPDLHAARAADIVAFAEGPAETFQLS